MTNPGSVPRAGHRLVLIAAGVAFGLDLVSKLLGSWLLDDRIVRIGPVTLRLVRNTGLAFGIGSGGPEWVVLAVTSGVTIYVATLVRRGVFGGVPAGLVVGGAVANLVDRAIDGTVVDLIDVGRWPVFNLADVFIIVGFFLLLSVDSRPSDNTNQTYRETAEHLY